MGEKATLREVRAGDASALLAMLTSEEVAGVRFAFAATVEGFEGFIAEAHQDRMRGNSFCFGIVPQGYDDAMGLFQVRQIEPGFGSAEWGFAIGSPFWGRGIFMEGRKGRHRLFFRGCRHAAPRGAVDCVERPWQCGAEKSGRASGRHASPFVSAEWAVLRSDSLVDSQGRLASGEGGVGAEIALTASPE
jgi:hypothetical protein